MSAISRAAPIVSALSLTGDSPQYVPIYRAMNQVELGRTMKYGYQMGNGSFDSGKKFTIWPADAYRLAQALPKLDLPEQQYNYRVVTSMASKEVISKSQISQGQIDIGLIKGPVLTVPSNLLPQLNRDARVTGGIKLLPKEKPWWVF